MRTTTPRVKREETKTYQHRAEPGEIPAGANDVHNVNAVVAFNFHGDQITTFEFDGEPYVAMRRIVENLGMDWSRQSKRLLEQESKFMCGHMSTVGADGKRRDMLSIPLAKLPLWLASINPNKVPDLDARAKIELYQEESAKALYDFWFKGGGDRLATLEVTVASMNEMLVRLTGMQKMTVHKVTDLQGDAIEIKTLAGRDPDVSALALELAHKMVAELQLATVHDLTAGKVIAMAGLTDMKGLRRLPRRVSDRLRQVHAEKGVAVRQATLGKSKAYIFDERVCREWLFDGGKETIAMWAQEMRGQGVLRLVVSKPKGVPKIGETPFAQEQGA